MIVIKRETKRWIILVCAACVLATILIVVLSSCGDKKKQNVNIGENKFESSNYSSEASSYTESEIKDIEDWWVNDAQIEEDGDTPIATN